ncbi:MAG: replicative DNA helicase [Desulfobacterales bacterium]
MEEINNIPPQAIELETAVIGSMLIEPSVIDDIGEYLTADVFYRHEHQLIYQAIIDLYGENKVIDSLTVSQKLEGTNKLKEAGGRLYITKMVSRASTAANIEEYAAILQQKAVERKLIRMGYELTRSTGGQDVADLLQKFNGRLEEITEFAYGKNTSLSFADLIEKSIEEYETREALDREGQTYGVKTPLADLTRLTNGWQQGDLIIIAGRPSMGKTAFSLAAAKSAAKDRKGVCMFSLEMQAIRLTDRILCGEAEIEPEDFRRGRLTKHERADLDNAAKNLRDMGITIDDNTAIRPDYIRARCRILKKKGKCDLVIIDYLQLMDGGRSKDQNREREIAEMSRKFKLMAMELDIPVMVISQLNRNCEMRNDKRPRLSDLRESGAIEMDADFVGFLYRPAYYKLKYEDDSLQGLGELIISKQRNGRTGIIEFRHNESMTRIYDKEKPGEAEPVQEDLGLN